GADRPCRCPGSAVESRRPRQVEGSGAAGADTRQRRRGPRDAQREAPGPVRSSGPSRQGNRLRALRPGVVPMPTGLCMKQRIEQAVRTVRDRYAGTPAVGLVLGSGWGPIAGRSGTSTSIPYAEIPGFPRCSVEGHAGSLILDQSWGPLTAILQGRAHRYEGWSLEEVTFPVRVLAACGVKTVVVTNASGGLQGVEPGELVLIADHLNLMGDHPLIGIGGSEGRFVEMVDAYDPGLLQLAEEMARKNGLLLKRITLAAVTGPSYETPAEAQMLRM